MIVRLFLSAIAAASFGLSALAQTQDTDIRGDAKPLTGSALLAAYQGVTHHGTYAFTRDGTGTAHYTETTRADGTVTYKEGDLVAEGAWVPSHDTLCFRYRSPNMSGGCFHVWTVGNCYYYYSTTLPDLPQEKLDLYWTARSVKAGETPDCDPQIG